jgi:hypothetical protein
MRLKLICFVLAGLLVVAATGCGSKKKSKSTTTAAMTTGGENLSSSDCANLAAAASIMTNAQQGKLPANIGEQVTALQTLAKKAPASVQADIEILGQAATPLLQKLKLKPGQTELTPAQKATLLQVMAQMDVAKLTTALADLGAWGTKACAGK